MRIPDPFAERYTNLQLIGRGGFGVVYKAWDPAMEREIALKLLNQELAVDADWRQRFRQEAMAASKFNHPNIVYVLDRGEYESQPFIVMEFVEGEPLSRIIERRTPLTIPERLFLIEQLCDGLHYAHLRHIIHRDIKPVNLVVKEDHDGTQVMRTLKILDFGIAKSVTTGQTSTGQMMFTPNYVSPEQIRGDVVDGRSDMFAVGAVAYELIVWEKAFTIISTNPFTLLDEVRRKVAEEPHRPMTAVQPDVDPELSEVIDRALAKHPADRFRDLADMRRHLHRISERLKADEARDATVILNPKQQAAVKRGREALEADDPTAAIESFQRALTAGSNPVVRRFIEQELEDAQERQTAKRAETRAREEEAAREAIGSAQAAFRRGAMTVAIHLLEEFKPAGLVEQTRDEMTRAAALLRKAERAVAEGNAGAREAVLHEVDRFSPADLIDGHVDRLRAQAAEQAARERAGEIISVAEHAFIEGRYGEAIGILEAFEERSRVDGAIAAARNALRAIDAASRSITSADRRARADAIGHLEAYPDPRLVAHAVRELRTKDAEICAEEDHRHAAAAAIESAERQFAGGDRAGAVSRLETFSPPHPTVTAAAVELRTRARQIEEEDKAQASAALERQTKDLAQQARTLFAEGRIDEAVSLLRRFEPREQIASTLKELQQAADDIDVARTIVARDPAPLRRTTIERLARRTPRDLFGRVVAELRQLDAERTAEEERANLARAAAAAERAALRARQQFARGEYRAALRALEAYTPAHPAVSTALEELQAEYGLILEARRNQEREEQERLTAAREEEEERQRREAERAANEHDVAALVAQAISSITDERFDAAARLLDRASKLLPDSSEVAVARTRLTEAVEANAHVKRQRITEMVQQIGQQVDSGEWAAATDLLLVAAAEGATDADLDPLRERLAAAQAEYGDLSSALVTLTEALEAAEATDDADVRLRRLDHILVAAQERQPTDSASLALWREYQATLRRAAGVRTEAAIAVAERAIERALEERSIEDAERALHVAEQAFPGAPFASARSRIDALRMAQEAEAAARRAKEEEERKRRDREQAARLARQEEERRRVEAEHAAKVREVAALLARADPAITQERFDDAAALIDQAADLRPDSSDVQVARTRLTRAIEVFNTGVKRQRIKELLRQIATETEAGQFAAASRLLAEAEALGAVGEQLAPPRDQLTTAVAEHGEVSSALVTLNTALDASTATDSAATRVKVLDPVLTTALDRQPTSGAALALWAEYQGALRRARDLRTAAAIQLAQDEVSRALSQRSVRKAERALQRAETVFRGEPLWTQLRGELEALRRDRAEEPSPVEVALRRIRQIRPSIAAAIAALLVIATVLVIWRPFAGTESPPPKTGGEPAPVAREESLFKDASSRLAAGQKAEAVQTALQSLKANPAYEPTLQLLAQLRTDAARTAATARDKAVSAGAGSRSSFRAAEQKSSAAQAITAPLRSDEAIRAFDDAADLFRRSETEAFSAEEFLDAARGERTAGRVDAAVKYAIDGLEQYPRTVALRDFLGSVRREALEKVSLAQRAAAKAGATSDNSKAMLAAGDRRRFASTRSAPEQTPEALAALRHAEGLYREAEKEASAVAASISPLLNMVKAQIGRGDLTGASATLLKGLGIAPRNSDLIGVLQTVVSKAESDVNAAKRAAETANASNRPEYANATSRLQSAAGKTKSGRPEDAASAISDYVEAARLYRDAAALGPVAAPSPPPFPVAATVSRANQLISERDYSGAATTVLGVLTKAPNNAELLKVLRQVLESAENDANAEKKTADAANASSRTEYMNATSRLQSAVKAKESGRPEDAESAVRDYTAAAGFYREAAARAREVAPPPNAETAIRQLIAQYEAAYESLDAQRVRRLKPSFTDFPKLLRSTDLTISNVRVVLAPDGQSATVNLTVQYRNDFSRGAPREAFNPPALNTVWRVQRTGAGWIIVE